jgi:hypothetical protein
MRNGNCFRPVHLSTVFERTRYRNACIYVCGTSL